MARRKISPATQQQVRERAEFLCEYCHTAEKWQYVPFTIDHVVPLDLGGTDDLDNLGLACFHCNRQKSNRLQAEVPKSGEEIPLFNPRQHNWADHFIWSADKRMLLGMTTIGKATIQALQLNRDRIIRIRQADIAVNRHPPIHDPVMEPD